MSHSIDPVSAGANVQQLSQNQKVTQTQTGSVPSAGTNARVAGAPDDASVTAAAKVAADAKLSTAQAAQSLQEINKVLDSLSISVQFKIDPDYKDVIVKVVDQDSGKLIRQIPTEDVVRIAKAMDNLKGLLFAQAV